MSGTIYIITHKEVQLPKIEGYTPLWVGASNSHYVSQEEYILDNTGENISKYNNSYCELTGLYWMWKNCSDDYVGLVHYRRFFINITSPILFETKSTKITTKKIRYEILSLKDIEKIISQGKIIVKEKNISDSVQLFFERTIGRDIIEKLLVALDDEREAMENFLQGHSFLCCNMFIAQKSIIDDYCEWLFPILNRVDALETEQTGHRYCNRELGYLGEILFGYYMKSRNIHYIGKEILDCGKVERYCSLGQYLASKIANILKLPHSSNL